MRSITAFVALISLGLTTAFAAPPPPPGPPTPLFQGVMVDAKGKTVGRFYPPPALQLFYQSNPVEISWFPQVVRQINGIWVSLTVDAQNGFFNALNQSVIAVFPADNCIPPAYFPTGPFIIPAFNNIIALSPNFPGTVQGVPFTVPGVSSPSIYFAGTPISESGIQSYRTSDNSCISLISYPGPGPLPMSIGPVQSVPVSSFGLTLPFSVQ